MTKEEFNMNQKCWYCQERDYQTYNRIILRGRNIGRYRPEQIESEWHKRVAPKYGDVSYWTEVLIPTCLECRTAIRRMNRYLALMLLGFPVGFILGVAALQLEGINTLLLIAGIVLISAIPVTLLRTRHF
jgi:hypothetical protein